MWNSTGLQLTRHRGRIGNMREGKVNRAKREQRGRRKKEKKKEQGGQERSGVKGAGCGLC